MWRLLAVLFCVISLSQGQTTQVNQCTSNTGALPINVFIEGCNTPPCDLPQLQDVIMHLVFRATKTMQNMRTLATAYLQGPLGIVIPIPYDLGENAHTCNFLNNSYCPVVEGEILQYTLRMYIESFFPQGTSVNIEFRVVDQSDEPAFCIRVPITIAAPASSAFKD